MTWTYDVTQLASNTTYQVRFAMGDTVQNDPQVQDEEIAFALSQRKSVSGAAAMCCRNLASRFSREADSVQGTELRTMYSAKAKAYAARAADFEQLASDSGYVMPFAGGISISQKTQQEQNSDRVPPNFSIGMDDNILPLGQAPNGETASDNTGTI